MRPGPQAHGEGCLQRGGRGYRPCGCRVSGKAWGGRGPRSKQQFV